MGTILALSGLILGAWSVRSICIKQQSNAKKLIKSFLSGFYFLAWGGTAGDDESQYYMVLIMLAIGTAVQLLCNLTYKEPKNDGQGILREHDKTLSFFDRDEKIDAHEQPYQSEDYVFDPKSKGLNNIAFTYINAEGVSLFREVDVKSFDGRYIEGYCHTAKKFRTFRIERIEGEIILRSTGEAVAPHEWLFR
ncbi:hypothetical protein [Erwinia sp. 198]|uniref:hypothetical protein n=1 Tax=Erwinia sp. 198 TaxID=2022746 RepID=UPI0018F2FD18|nr:hypothetical protein [Erwinia sp. 198]